MTSRPHESTQTLPMEMPLLDSLVQYEPRRIEGELEDLLDKLRQIVIAPRTGELLGPEIADHVNTTTPHISDRLAAPFKIVVIGEFKRGKSSLINAMLREPLLMVDVMPETVAITELHHGAPGAHLRLLEGGHVALGELGRERLEPILDHFGDSVSHIEIRAPIDGLRAVTWVDTPGAGDLFQRFEDRVAGYLAEADLVVIVVSPISPLSGSEIAFHTRALARHEFPKLYVVLNMIDLVRTTEDRARITAKVRERMGRAFPGAQLFALSAADELARLGLGERPLPDAAPDLAAGFGAFRASIEELVRVRGDGIQIERGLDLTARLIDALRGRIELIRAALAAESGQLEQVAAAHQARKVALEEETARNRRLIEERTNALAREAKVWLRGFTTRLIAEVMDQARALPSERLERHLPFFLTDILRQALATCIETHLPQLDALASDRLQNVVNELQPIAGSHDVAQLSQSVTFGPLEWDHLHLVDLVADSFFMGAGLVVDVLGHFLAGRDGTGTMQSRLKGQQAALDEALATIVERSYDRLQHLLTLRLEADRATQAQAIGEALNQAQVLLTRATGERVEQEQALARLATQLGTLRANLEKVRPQAAQCHKLGHAEQPPRIFISYRREDSQATTDRIFEHLASEFPRRNLFRDIDSITKGRNFREWIESSVAQCDVLLAIIGPQWLCVTDENGRPRLENPADFVRLELEAALGRDIPLIPITIAKGRMPKIEELPESLREFAYRNGTTVRHDPDFVNDMRRLIADLQAAASRAPREAHEPELRDDPSKSNRGTY